MARGDKQTAWRFLTSIIDRAPGQGRAYAAVARELERVGDAERAAIMWHHASEMEPTNPTWLLRRAQTLHARGAHAAADALLKQIVEGKWQDRFARVQHQAKWLVAGSKKKKKR